MGVLRLGRRQGRSLRDEKVVAVKQLPFSQLKNSHPPLKVISDDQVEKIHQAAMEILENVGIKILNPTAREILKLGGFSVIEEDQKVHFDRDGVMELVALAPSKVSVRGRDPAKRVVMGDGNIAFVAVGGPPFVSDLERGRRPGNHADMCDFIRLTQMLNILHIEGGCSVEPCDLPASTRHLDFYLACCTLTDKPWKPLSVGRDRARDALEMAKILFGESEESLASDPVFFVNTNTNTPLVLDEEISLGLIEFAKAGQVICVTPFALSGAMAPVTLAGALALQTAETLAACALVQLIRPGCPYVYGAFASNVDMRTGSPAFGTPEYALAAQASGQIARRYGLPWRSSNVNASNAPDAQAAYEAQMSLWSSVTGHASVLNQGAGWLEGGLVASFEKLIIDAEMLQMMAVWMKGLAVEAEDLGLEAVCEVGPGGHFFGAAHTLQRYATAFYSPLLSDWSNFENWTDKGSNDAASRAHLLWKKMLNSYEAPGLDPGTEEALRAFVRRRKEEIPC